MSKVTPELGKVRTAINGTSISRMCLAINRTSGDMGSIRKNYHLALHFKQ